MSLADDNALREVLEGLTRLRLAHDRFTVDSDRRDLPPLRPMIVPTPVESITHRDKEYVYCKNGKAGPTVTKLYERLCAIQMGDIEDPYGWTEAID